MTEPTSILIVDDNPEQLRDQIALQFTDGATTEVVHPNNIEMLDLETSDLVLVDYRLEMWNERDTQPVISLRPQTGLALTVLLREQVDRANKSSLTAFALHSGHLSEIQGRLPSGTVAQVLARLNNLEWVFSKEEPRRYDQMVRLARAVRMLPRDWPQDSGCAASMVRELLAIGDSGSSERCWRDVQECRVPVHELTAGAHGLLFVRWLLHQVLPYPSFLWEVHWVAARLRVPVETLRRILSGTSRLARDLRYACAIQESCRVFWETGGGVERSRIMYGNWPVAAVRKCIDCERDWRSALRWNSIRSIATPWWCASMRA